MTKIGNRQFSTPPQNKTPKLRASEGEKGKDEAISGRDGGIEQGEKKGRGGGVPKSLSARKLKKTHQP